MTTLINEPKSLYTIHLSKKPEQINTISYYDMSTHSLLVLTDTPYQNNGLDLITPLSLYVIVVTEIDLRSYEIDKQVSKFMWA